MEKLQKLHGLLETEGYEPGDFQTFVATYSDPIRQEKLHKLLETEGYEPEPIDKFRQTYFSATAAVVDQKKKTTPDQGVGSPVSQPQSKTASVVTPQSKPAVSPTIPKYQYGNEPVPVNPVAKATPLSGLGGVPMEKKVGLEYFSTPDGKQYVKGKAGTVEIDDSKWKKNSGGTYDYIGESGSVEDFPHPREMAEKLASGEVVGGDDEDIALDEPMLKEQVVPGEMRTGSGVLSAKSQRDRSYSQHFGPRLSYSRERDEPKGLSGEMGETFDKFQKYRNQATIAAQKNTMDEAAGNIEYKKSQRDPNPDWAEQQKYALEDAQAAERAKVATIQPLVSKMLDYYDAKAGDKGIMDNPVGAAALAGPLAGILGKDRDDAPAEQLRSQLIGTPEGATLEQELQKIYKRTNLKDQTSVDNALLDAKQLMFEKLADKDVQIWDDFAQTNKAMADYNPQAYHKRIEGQIEKKYGMAGMDKDVAYNKLMDYSLNRGVMDEERTAEAKAVLNVRTLRDEVSRAEREGSVFRIDQAKQKLAAAEKEVQGMESQRLSSLDKRVGIIQDLIVNETDQEKIGLLKKDLDLAKAQRAGFINPNAQVMATYAKFQDQANAVAPKGTPMEKLQKLYAELEFDRQQIMGRIQQAEAKGGPLGFAAQEMINSVGGQGHNDDHKRLVQIESQIKDLAPIVFLNENPVVQDKKQGFFPAFNTGLMSSLAGQGSPLSNTQRQEDALSLARNLQLAGVTPEALNDPTMLGIKDRMEEPGLASGEFIGSLAGASTGLMASIMATTALTKGLGLGAAINRAVTWGNKALGLTGKSGMILPLLGDAIESGINYEGAGRISVDNNDELSFLGGFLGGAAASATGGGTNSALNSFKKVVSKWFGDKGQEAVGLIVNFGASRLGSGTGELSEEFGQQIGQLWETSSTGQEFWKRMDDQFGTLDKATRFVVSTMVMGAFMGGAHSGGLGEYLTNLSKEQLAALPPEQRPVVQEVVDQVADEQAAFVEGGLNPTPEDVASVEAEQEGIEPEKKKELTPEAQAAQAELERRAAIDKTMVEQGLGDRVNTAQSQEDRLREERGALVAQQERQELTDNEKKRLAELETVVTGLDQIAAGEQFVSPTTEVQVEAKPEVITTTSGETIAPVEGSDTKKKVTIDVGGTPMEIEFDTEGLGEDLETFQSTLTPDAKDAFVESPLPIEETVVEENPFGDPTPREQPKRRDEQIVDQINEFFGSLAGTISENSKEQLKKYARRILAGEDPAKVMQGQSAKSIELVNEVVKQIQNESAPTTDESIVDVTGESPTPIAAEETVVAESPAPVTQKKGKGAANGGKSKPKANPNRKTKSKPVADLTPTEIVSEAIAVSAEVDENPTTENKERQVEIEERIGNQVAPTNEVTTETEVVAESPAPALKPKKSRGKQQPLPEGVEDMFTEARVSGRRTSWMKKDGKWFFRNHKPGTKISEQQFERDWQEAAGKDIDRAERMAAMDPLTRELANSAKEWVAAWGDLVTLRNPYKGEGKVFASVDLGIVGNSIKLGAKTAKVGINLARVLAQNGVYTYENWRNGMIQALGDHVLPFLDQAWESVKTIIPEGSTSADIQTNVVEEQVEEVEEAKPKKKKEPVEDSGEKTGTQKLMEKYISKAGEVLAKVIANSPMLKSVYDQKAQYEKALKEVKEAIAANKIGQLMARLMEASTTDTADVDQFQRMILVDMYSSLTDNATEVRNRAAVTGDKAAEKQAQKDIDRFTTNTTSMLNAMSANALGAGRSGAASGMWRFIGGSMDTYAMGVIDKANRAIAKSKKTANGKTLEETSKEIADNLNEEKKKKANEIADSVDGAIDSGVNQSKPKRKSSTIAGKTAAEFAELKRQAKEKYDSIRLGGTMNAILSPNGFAKTAAAAEFGYYALLEGAVTFKDWVASMKKDLPDLTDQDLTDIWDSELNGRTLSEESKNVLREKSLKSINSALSSSERAVENTDSAKETKKLRDQMAKDLAATIEAGESIDDFKKKYGLTDEQAEDLSESIAKADQAAIDKLAGKKVKGFDPKVYLPKPKGPASTDAQKADAKKKAETRVKVKEVIRDHFSNPDGQPLIDKLTEAGLDLEQAQKVEQAVRDNAQVILAQAVAGELDHIQSGESKRKNRDYKPPKKGGKKRTNAEILIDNLVDGNITDRFVQGLVRHKFGMGRTATAEEVTRLRKLGKAVKEAQAGSVFEKMAMKELATLIDSMMPKTMTDDLSALFNGLIMSSVLNSVSTILVNPYSVTDHWFLGAAKALIDPQQWVDLATALFKKDGGNPALLNPLAKILTKMMAGYKPTLSGMQSFASGMVTGTTSGKYDESVMDSDPSKMLPALEREQRTAFGRALTSNKWWNPYSHIFGKTIGRILSATDAGMTMAYGDLEFLDALRVAIGKKPNGSIAELKALAGEYLSQKSQLWQDSLQQAQDEATAMEALTGKPVPDVTVQVRAREIVRKKFAQDPRVMLDESELASIQKVAQYNTLTLKRQGGFGKAATVMAKLKSGDEKWQKALALVLKPFILFTEIPGNYGDALLDNTPVYNLFRAAGISPTGLAQRAGWTETSAAIGEWGSRERRKQLEQAFFSNVLFVAAYALIGMDDDDDDITGKQINTDESYQLFGIPYKAFASLAPSLIFARVLRDSEKDPKYKTMSAPEAGFMRMTSAMTALTGFYTDQSFMKGLQDFGRMATTLAEFSKGETTTQAAFRAVVRPYLNLATKPLPQNQGVTKFIMDCFDPKKYTEEDWSEMFAMTLGMERINNEKKIGLFGEEYLQYPGYNVLNVKSLIDKAAGDHPMKKQYEFLARTKTFIKAPTNPVAKFLDPKSSTGFTFREFTPKEWSTLNKKAGGYFKTSLDKYIDGPGESLRGKIDVEGNKLLSQAQADILDLWSKARSKAKKELFGKILLSDTEAQNLIDEKFND